MDEEKIAMIDPCSICELWMEDTKCDNTSCPVKKMKHKKLHIYHHTVGTANQYFLSYGERVLFEIPKCIGKRLCKTI